MVCLSDGFVFIKRVREENLWWIKFCFLCRVSVVYTNPIYKYLKKRQFVNVYKGSWFISQMWYSILNSITVIAVKCHVLLRWLTTSKSVYY